jgi:hypothetical protein
MATDSDGGVDRQKVKRFVLFCQKKHLAWLFRRQRNNVLSILHSVSKKKENPIFHHPNLFMLITICAQLSFRGFSLKLQGAGALSQWDVEISGACTAVNEISQVWVGLWVGGGCGWVYLCIRIHVSKIDDSWWIPIIFHFCPALSTNILLLSLVLSRNTNTNAHTIHIRRTHRRSTSCLPLTSFTITHERRISYPSDYAHLFLYLVNSMADSTLLITTRLSSFRLSNANIQALTATNCVQG